MKKRRRIVYYDTPSFLNFFPKINLPQQLNVKNPRFFHSLLPKPNPFFPTQKQCFPYSFLLKSSMINVAVQQ